MVSHNAHIRLKWREWLQRPLRANMPDRMINGCLTGSEKAGLHRSWVELHICKAKRVSGLFECWQCDCGVHCLGLTILLPLSKKVPSEENSSCRPGMATESPKKGSQIAVRVLAFKVKDNSLPKKGMFRLQSAYL